MGGGEVVESDADQASLSIRANPNPTIRVDTTPLPSARRDVLLTTICSTVAGETHLRVCRTVSNVKYQEGQFVAGFYPVNNKSVT